MKIRLANKFDIPQLAEMLRHYRDSGTIKGLSVENEETGMKILTAIIVGLGIALVSEKDNKLTGMLLAIKSPFMWDANKLIMSEIAYWVEPEYRGSTAGYRLLAKYVEHCDELKDSGVIVNYTMSQMAGQKLDYSRFGLKPVETTWSI
jgi:N-acetylglutamate synthase-like GNAT family acetyltransferase